METSHDEKEINLEYLEVSYQACLDAIEKGDLDTAHLIAADTKDAGFDSAYRVLKWEIEKAQKGHLPAIKSIE